LAPNCLEAHILKLLSTAIEPVELKLFTSNEKKMGYLTCASIEDAVKVIVLFHNSLINLKDDTMP